MFSDPTFATIWSAVRDVIADPLVAESATGIAVGAGTWIALALVRLFVLRRIHRATHPRDGEDVSFVGRVIEIIESLPVYVDVLIAFSVGSQFVVLPDLAATIIHGLTVTVIVVEITRVTTRLVKTLLDAWRRTSGRTPTAIHGLRVLISFALWATAGLIILSSLGFEISTLVASLGVTGIVVAFALQNILADIFSSFSIYFDRPFEIGDSIEIGTDSGTVKRIGLKTTHIETLRGERLIISNRELTSARVRNFRYLKRRRVVLVIGVAYDTPTAKLKKIPEWVQGVIEATENATFDRTYFTTFGASSLDFEIVYFAEDPDYAPYLRIQQAVNFGIREVLEKNGVEMAFPTQTVYLKK